MTDKTMARPAVKPKVANFSSGPCAKRPGYSLDNLRDACLGRSHRSAPGKAKLAAAISQTRTALNVPQDYLIGIVPASDTGAFEMAMWNMLGARGVDLLGWEAFGNDWVGDVVKQLRLADTRTMQADYGDLPDLTAPDFAHDVVFTWNGTTSGVCVPNGDWIDDARQGLTLCDATSAVFAIDLPWHKLDVITYSWQKVLGGEAAHGMLILSPRAVERLTTYTPDRPLPKVFRLTKGGKLIDGIFRGETINTPSMLAVEDYLDALGWVQSIGGMAGMVRRVSANNKVLGDWVANTKWVDFLCAVPANRSPTSVCLKITDADVLAQSSEAQAAFAKALVVRLDKEGVAYDIGAYRDAPAGLRIWAGATVEASDLAALTAWLDYAFATTKAELIN